MSGGDADGVLADPSALPHVLEDEQHHGGHEGWVEAAVRGKASFYRRDCDLIPCEEAAKDLNLYNLKNVRY